MTQRAIPSSLPPPVPSPPESDVVLSTRHRGPSVLTSRERRIALALAEAAMPAAGGLPGGGDETIVRFERLLSSLGSTFAGAARAGLWAAELWSIPRFGRPAPLCEEIRKHRSRFGAVSVEPIGGDEFSCCALKPVAIGNRLIRRRNPRKHRHGPDAHPCDRIRQQR